MIHPPSQPELSLRKALEQGPVVFVAGTGVSMSATYDPARRSAHPQASWTGLLKHGLQKAVAMGQIPPDKANLHQGLLDREPTTQVLISAASAVTTALGGSASGIYKDWLEETIGQIRPVNREVPDALHALREAKHLLATTNYDDILLDHPSPLQPVTWMDGDDIIGAVRHRTLDRVIYLHGYWKRPDSVILDGRSYDGIARHETYRGDLEAFWRTTTWVYVGCGVGGLSDPDFGLLLERHGARARDAGHWDFCLVSEKDKAAFQGHFEDRKLNIAAVSYGKGHGDLPGFLRSLLPVPMPAPALAAAVLPPVPAPAVPIRPTVPAPPAFHAVPPYVGRFSFIGRQAELQMLTKWAKPADPANVLLFDAIGGSGKSMLTWEWTTRHAMPAREGCEPWAGRFWYSFYEKGAIMRGFCQQALAYMTGEPLEHFDKWPAADLHKELLTRLQGQPWLLILDGLERVLVAYHRIDAAEVPDEEVNQPADKILNREPCDAIRDEDTALLRALAAAAPSKILISSRLIPRALLNPAGLPLPGVRREALPGLEDEDAEALLCSCGVSGTPADMRYYLKNYCGNHPLVIGALAGLINSPGPHRGKFDGWAADENYGAKLNLASLDLIQSRNHILEAALAALKPASRQLLSTLALLNGAVDYETVAAFNPHLPPKPEEVKKPGPPEEEWSWEFCSDEEKAARRQAYEEALAKHKAYEQALRDWHQLAAVREAPMALGRTMEDLEQRRLLQYDAAIRRYDLHPVVRGVAAGGLNPEDRERYGLRVVDHFSALPHHPYVQARTMEDVENGMQVVRTLLKLGRYEEAFEAYRGDLSEALFFNLEAHGEILSLLRPFFPVGWHVPPGGLDGGRASYLANDAALALQVCGASQQALDAYGAALKGYLEREEWSAVRITLSNVGASLSSQNRLAKSLDVSALALDLGMVTGNDEDVFRSRLDLFTLQAILGQRQEAEETWSLLDPMGRGWSRAVYRQGYAEEIFARYQFWRHALREEHLTQAESLAVQDGNRQSLRDVKRLRGGWCLAQGEWALAAKSFDEAVSMARERQLVDATAEAGLALARFHLGELPGEAARHEAGRLEHLPFIDPRYVAMLWRAAGDTERARDQALAAYESAWADGEPYVRRYELTKTTELLQEMKVPLPELPVYDPARDEPLPWEAEVRAAIEKLRARKAEEAATKGGEEG